MLSHLNIRVTLGETAKEEGELVCYLVLYCIFVTFAWAGTHSVYMVTSYLALRHPEGGGQGTRDFHSHSRGFCQYQGNTDRESDKTKRPLL